MTVTEFIVLLIIAAICGSIGQALAGYLGVEEPRTKPEDNAIQTLEGQSSYSKHEPVDSQTKGRLELLEQMQQKLDERQMISVINIIGHLVEHPDKIATVLGLF